MEGKDGYGDNGKNRFKITIILLLLLLFYLLIYS